MANLPMLLPRHLTLLLLILGACSAAQQTASDVHGASADDYATAAPAGPGALGGRAPELESMLRSACAEQLHVTVAPDPRLAQVADWLAERFAAGDPPQMPRRIAVTTRLGVPFPTPGIIEIRYSPGIDGARLRESIATQVKALGEAVVLARYGIAVRTTLNAEYAVAVLTAADVAFAPVPRHAHVGDALTLHGTLAPGLQHPHVVVTQPDGSSRSQNATGQQFQFAVMLPQRGTYAVELLGDGPLGPRVVANFPVYADMPEPPLPREQAVEAVGSPAAIEAELLTLINQERAKAGVQPLTLWPALANVARGHSQDMVANKFIAHVSPTMGAPEDRLKRAGIPFRQYGENVGMASTTIEVHEGLMASPGHRQAIVNPAFVYVGIGAALQLQGTSYVPVVTEDFVAVAPQ